jgi:hypothetical protein
VGHVIALTDPRTSVGLVLLGGVVMAGPAALAANVKIRVGGGVRNRASVDVTVEALDAVVHRVRHLFGKGGTVATGLVTVGADRAVDRFELLVLCPGGAGPDEAKGNGEGDEGNTPVWMDFLDGRPEHGLDLQPNCGSNFEAVK